MIQGGHKDEERNREPFPFDPKSIDAVVLSHAHIDHSGRLPLLVKAGFRGFIYTHRACRDLCRIMLKDAGFLSEKDAEWENRKRARKGLKPVEPLFTVEDAKFAMQQFKGLIYALIINQIFNICEVACIRGIRSNLLGDAIHKKKTPPYR